MTPGPPPSPPGLQAVHARIAAAKGKGKLVAWRYVDIRPEDGMVVSVRCKLCGRGIYGRRPVGDPQIVGRSKDRSQVMVQVEVEYGPLPGYRQYVIQHEDGTAHLTALCQTCGNRELDAETLEALYLADLEQTASEITAGFPDGEARSSRFLQEHGKPSKRQQRMHRLPETG